MSRSPQEISLFHITPVENLPGIVRDGMLFSEAHLGARGGPSISIGMEEIKSARLTTPVKCHPGDFVGSYVPFNFCPRSVMLYIISRGNHPGLSYRGGQVPVLHLEFNLQEVVEWANSQERRWAFTLSNARAVFTEFRNRLECLDEIEWTSVASDDFRVEAVKHGKQAEFLVHESVPWHLVRRIGACTPETQRQAQRALGGAAHQPPVEVIRTWYF